MGTRGKLVKALQASAMRLARRYNPYSPQPSNRLLGRVTDWPQLCAFSFPKKGSYLVDPASSHMLVSKIKPCMSKYKLLIL